jgi:hypothetical protein
VERIVERKHWLRKYPKEVILQGFAEVIRYFMGLPLGIKAYLVVTGVIRKEVHKHLIIKGI